MRRAFTLIELLIAASISAVLLTGVLISFGGVWQLARNSTVELQLSMHAWTVRYALLNGAVAGSETFKGLRMARGLTRAGSAYFNPWDGNGAFYDMSNVRKQLTDRGLTLPVTDDGNLPVPSVNEIKNYERCFFDLKTKTGAGSKLTYVDRVKLYVIGTNLVCIAEGGK